MKWQQGKLVCCGNSVASRYFTGYVQTAHELLAASFLCRFAMLLKSQQKSIIGKQHRMCHTVSDITEQNSHDAQLLLFHRCCHFKLNTRALCTQAWSVTEFQSQWFSSKKSRVKVLYTYWLSRLTWINWHCKKYKQAKHCQHAFAVKEKSSIVTIILFGGYLNWTWPY